MSHYATLLHGDTSDVLDLLDSGDLDARALGMALTNAFTSIQRLEQILPNADVAAKRTDSAPSLPEPMAHAHSDGEFHWDQSPTPAWWPVSLYTADQVRQYADLCVSAARESNGETT